MVRGNKDPDAACSPVRRSTHEQVVASPDGHLRAAVTGQKRATPLDVAAWACRGPARPAVTMVMPPGASRLHPDGPLLCRHHFRASQASLQAAGAAAHETGMSVMTRARTANAPSLSVGEPGAAAHLHRE